MQSTAEEERRYAELQVIALDAARHGEPEVLAPMLDAGMPVELRDEKGNSLLMLAAYHGHAETVSLLLGHGAEPDARNDRQQTPLAGVAFKGHLEIARRLLQGGADANADQGGGRTPAMFAAMFGHTEIVKLLEEKSEHPARSRMFGLKLSSLARLTSGLRCLFFRKQAIG